MVKKWILLILLILVIAAIATTLYYLASPSRYTVIPMSLGNVSLYSNNSTGKIVLKLKDIFVIDFHGPKITATQMENSENCYEPVLSHNGEEQSNTWIMAADNSESLMLLEGNSGAISWAN